jgi:predicted metal-dependent HD superfamily phosphohydrolase
MATTKDIVREASEHVSSMLSTQLPGWATYHDLSHTVEVVQLAEEIGEGSRLNRADMEIVQLAAWFHDTGYVEGTEGHEDRSAEKATAFLREMGYPEERIERVVGCILATKIPQQPKNLVEQVLCDADLVHIGKKSLPEKNELMRLEHERRDGKSFTDEEWLNAAITFVSRHSFHTTYAKQTFGKRRLKNLMMMQEQLRGLQTDNGSKQDLLKLKKEKLSSQLEKDKRPERGIETMFRVVPQNHLSLSSMADSKANLLISTNAIIISIVFGLLVSKLDTNPHLVAPTLILLVVCLATIVFAILATRPNVTSGTFTREDIQQKKVNLLFFGNFHNSSLEDFEWGMKEMMNDREFLYGSMIKDLYFLGRVLGVKYKYLRISYNVFMFGLIIAVAAYAIAFSHVPEVIE